MNTEDDGLSQISGITKIKDKVTDSNDVITKKLTRKIKLILI